MTKSAASVVKALTITAFLLLLPAEATAAESDTVTLVTPIVYGTHLPGLGRPALTFAREIKQRSDGAVVLDLKQPGEGTKPHEILDKVSDGKVDAGFATASFWAAKIPAAALFGGFPFGPDAKTYLAWFEDGNGRKLYQEVYDQAGLKVHVIPCAFGGAEAGGWFVEEIDSKKDLEDLRMRIFGLGARAMSRVGVVPVLVPGGDLVEAFKDGKIKGAELYTPAVDRMQGLQEAAKFIYMPGWHQPETVLELLINKERWSSLGEERQALIEETCSDLLQTTLGASAALQAEALSSLSNKDSVKIMAWPDDVLKALRGAWGEIAEEEGIRDYMFKEVLKDLDNFRAKQSAGTGKAPEAAARAATPAPHAKP